jgi:chaperonin cofactor prefoldin
MKQTQAAAKAPKAKQAGSGRLRTYARSVLDRLFLRSKIWEMRKEVRGLKRAVPELEQSLDLSVTLLSKKLDYLLAKIDAYADVDDRNHAALQADLAKRHETLEARFGAVEASGAELAADLRDLKKATPELEASLDEATTLLSKKLDYLQARIDAHVDADDGHHTASRADLAKRHETLEARLAAIDEAIARRSEVETAFREEVRSRYDAMAARLTVIEMGNAAVADKLEVVQRAGKEIGEVVGNGGRDLMARIEAGQAKLENIEAMQTGSVAKIEKSVERIAFNEFLKFDLPLPATRNWAASPDFLLHLYQHIAAHRPKVVVELGSGVSTLVAAAALAANGDDGRLYSLDHDGAYARATSELLSQHGLSHIASVHHAPLGPWQPPHATELGEEWQWYSVPEAVNALDAINLLVVDGPPKATGPVARYPAVPHFRSRLTPGSTILLDDARRPDEKTAAEAWSKEDGLTLELLLRPDHGFEKGLAMLIVKGPA